MTDQNRIIGDRTIHYGDYVAHAIRDDNRILNSDPLLNFSETFTRSNGTIIARLYERLTKASRRRSPTDEEVINAPHGWGAVLSWEKERAYRQGLYDAFKALQEELSA